VTPVADQRRADPHLALEGEADAPSGAQAIGRLAVEHDGGGPHAAGEAHRRRAPSRLAELRAQADGQTPTGGSRPHPDVDGCTTVCTVSQHPARDEVTGS